MSGVGADLTECRIDGNPFVFNPTFRPGVVQKSIVLFGIHEAVDHARWYILRARERGVQITVSLAGKRGSVDHDPGP